MSILILSFFVAIGAFVLHGWLRQNNAPSFLAYAALLIAPLAIAGGLLLGSSVSIPSDKTGIVIRHFGSNMPAGHIVAMNGEQGPQAEILGPGWHFGYWPFVYDIEEAEVATVAQGELGVVTALDGKPLSPGQTFATPWPSVADMLDPVKFLTGQGQRGAQMTVLTPGSYRYNTKLHKIDRIKALVVAPGTVAVIKSNTTAVGSGGAVIEHAATKNADIVNGVPLVDEGQAGVWKRPLTPGAYFINTAANNPITVKTTQRVYVYQARVQRDTKEKVNNDAGWAIAVRSKDGFTFPVDVRISCSIKADDAPYLVALLGDPDKTIKDDQEDEELEILESKLILPAIRSIFRDVAEGMGAIEFINSRSQIEKVATERMITALSVRRITCDVVSIGQVHLDFTDAGRNLIKTQTDREVAVNNEKLYDQQRQAELKRAEYVKAQTEADRQKELVQASFEIQVKESLAKAKVAEAKGEAESTIERSKGDAAAQINVGKARAEAYAAMVAALGRDQVATLENLKAIADGKILPGTIVPQVMVGQGGGMSDAVMAGILHQQATQPQKTDKDR